jgi:MoxR-like ATPase
VTNEHHTWAKQVLEQTGKKLSGLDEVVKLCLIAYCTDGHVLLEGNPGLGKTKLVRVLSGAIELQAGRIQFTPDLMPSDITGTMLPDYESGVTHRWVFQPGPIFASFLLADEINRATPKTQSALLEAMGEGQVTVLGQTYKLPQPFVVMATQNPIDHSGTYDLPEAQADRFLFKITMPMPDKDNIERILKLNNEITRAQSGTDGEMASPRRALFGYANPWLKPNSQPGDYVIIEKLTQAEEAFRRRARSVEGLKPQEFVELHVIHMILASNQRFDEIKTLDQSQIERLKQLVPLLFPFGLGPRAAIGLLKATKAWALLFTGDQAIDRITPSGRDLAHVVIPTLRHRVKTQFDRQQRYEELTKKLKGSLVHGGDTLATMLADFCINTAPARDKAGPYRDTVRDELQTMFASGKGA